MSLITPRTQPSTLMVPARLAPAHLVQARRQAPPQEVTKHRTSTDDFVSPEQVAEQVAQYLAYVGVTPKAAGWTVMVLMLTIPDVTDGGLIMDEDYQSMRTKASPQGVVVGIGASAYREDDDRFREGPWCALGDRVIYGRYAGKPFQMSNGQELAFLTDTDIIATVENGWLDTVEDDDVSA